MKPYYILIRGKKRDLIIRNMLHPHMSGRISLFALSYSPYVDRYELLISLFGFELTLMVNKN